jgi:hypothetical protein
VPYYHTADIGAAVMHMSESILPADKQRLTVIGDQLRQHTITSKCDLEGWRLSRLLRDAETRDEGREAERRLARYRQQSRK